MKAVFGILSLVIVLAVIGAIAKKQLQVVGGTVAPAVVAAPDATTTAPAPKAQTVPQQAKAIEEQVRANTVRALQEGARRTEAAER